MWACICIFMYAQTHMHAYGCTCIACVFVHVCAYACIFACGCAAGMCASVCLCGPVFVCVCWVCVFWPTRSVPCAQTSRVIHQGDSTNQIKQETNYSSLHSFGAETQREHTTGGEAKVVSWLLCCWFGTSHQCYILEEKNRFFTGDRKQGRGS